MFLNEEKVGMARLYIGGILPRTLQSIHVSVFYSNEPATSSVLNFQKMICQVNYIAADSTCLVNLFSK